MFDDPKKELERLQEQLLKDEEWFEKELDSAKRMIGQTPEKKTRRTAAQPAKTAARPAQTTRTTQETRVMQPVTNAEAETVPVRNYANGYGKAELASRAQKGKQEEEAPQPKKKSIKGLLILACLEILGILGVMAYWVLALL